jgi:hypothetical protein
MTQVQVSLVATPDLRALDVGLTARSCHKSVIIKLIKKKKTKKKKPTGREKTNEEKGKKSELTGLTLQTKLTRQTLDSRHESLITK